MPNFVIINDIIPQKPKIKRKERDYKNFNQVKFNQEISNIDTTSLINTGVINDVYNNFHEKFIEIFNSHAPYRILSNKEIKWLRKPWITFGIKRSIKRKNLYYGKFLRTKNKCWYDQYKYLRNNIKKLTRISKKNSMQTISQKMRKTQTVLCNYVVVIFKIKHD